MDGVRFDGKPAEVADHKRTFLPKNSEPPLGLLDNTDGTIHAKGVFAHVGNQAMGRERLLEQIRFQSSSPPGFGYPFIQQGHVQPTHISTPRIERSGEEALLNDMIPIGGSQVLVLSRLQSNPPELRDAY